MRKHYDRPLVEINGKTDLSKYVASATVAEFQDMIDDGFGRSILGLKEWWLEVAFYGGDPVLSALLFDLVGEKFKIRVEPTSVPVDESNPAFSGEVILTNHDPLNLLAGGLVTEIFHGSGELKKIPKGKTTRSP